MRQAKVVAAAIAATLSVGLSSGGAGAASTAADAAVSVRALSDAHALTARATKLVAASVRRARAAGITKSVVQAPSALALSIAALPTTANVADPLSDNGPFFDPRGDILETGIATDKASLAVGSFTDLFDDPSTGTSWTDFETAIEWGLDVNHDGTPDYIVVMFNDVVDGFGVVAGVLNSDATNVLCGGNPTWDPTNNGYFVVFSRACVHSPVKVQGQGFLDYETATGSSVDITAWTAAIGPTSTVTQQAHSTGYWMLGADGHVYAFGGAVGFPGRVANAAAMAPRKDGKGYWVVDRAGHVFTYGTAPFFGGSPALAAGEFVSTISATANGHGYWLFTNRGRAFPFGNAGGYGDMSGTHLNGPIVASVATSTGLGYYMVGSDGGIFCFGDARFHGSTGGLRLNKPVVGISPTSTGRGYWLVASDGGVFAFNAPFRGSMGGTKLNRAVDGLVAFGNGYLMAASDGGIFDFSNKPFFGSLAQNPPTAPIIGLAAFST